MNETNPSITPSTWNTRNHLQHFFLQYPNASILRFFDQVDLLSFSGPRWKGNKTQEGPETPNKDVKLNALKGEVTIPLYSLIFCLAVVGNVLVILTLAQNRRMRTITNVFLLNLAVSDLLLAMFCMPFTLVPTLLQNFVFGLTMCVLIRYMQGVTVGVCVFTLVTISLERYFAICQPLRSRRWQTLTHSYRTIALIWTVSLLIMIPTAVCQRIVQIGGLDSGRHKCVEKWSDEALEKFYTIFLDTVLLVLPMLLMLCAYGQISVTLYHGIQRTLDPKNSMELRHLTSRYSEVDIEEDSRYSTGGTSTTRQECELQNNPSTSLPSTVHSGKQEFTCLVRFKPTSNGYPQTSVVGQRYLPRGSPLRDTQSKGRISVRTRSTYLSTVRRREELARSVCAKRRSIRMLFAVVLEFFVCWTPLYVVQTWHVFDAQHMNSRVSVSTMNLIHLLAFLSSCSNPITYCFMSKRFRQCFLAAVCRCCRASRRRGWAAPETPTWEVMTGLRRTGSNWEASARLGK